jgi:hypothetical protein
VNVQGRVARVEAAETEDALGNYACKADTKVLKDAAAAYLMGTWSRLGPRATAVSGRRS